MHDHPSRWLRASLLLVIILSLLFGVQWRAEAQSPSPAALRLLQSDAARVVVELDVPAYEAQPQTFGGATYTRITVAGLDLGNEAGKPQLPRKGALIAIPAGAEASLEILADDSQVDTLAAPPLPAASLQSERAPTEPLPRLVGTARTPDAAAYARDALYPADAVQLGAAETWRSQRVVRLALAPFQYNAATRQLVFHRHLRVSLNFRYADNAASAGEANDEGAFEAVFAQTLLNYASAKNWRVAMRSPQATSPPSSVTASGGPWYKIAVNSDGIYQLTCAQLASAGINLATLDLRTLQIFKQDVELAIDVSDQNANNACDGGDALLFFAQAARTRYTDTNLYWLTFGSATGKRMTARNGAGTSTLSNTFVNRTHVERDWIYISSLPMTEGSDHWYSYNLPNAYDPDGNGDATSADYTFTADNVALGAYTASLQVSLVGFSGGAHHTLTYVNGNLVGDSAWSDRVPITLTLSFPQAYLRRGANVIRVSETLPLPDTIYVNAFDLSYVSPYRASGDTLRFRQPTSGAWQYALSNFSSAEIEAFDISDPYNVARIANGSVTSAPIYDVFLPLITRSGTSASAAPSSVTPSSVSRNSYTLQFADSASAPREYFALTTAQRKSPFSLTLDTPSDLRATSNRADYIVIAYGAFVPNVAPLGALRQSQGMRVQVVDVQDVYDEFSDGLMDAQAIHDFLRYAYDNWQSPKPQFVLLVGNGNFDFKNVYGTNEPNFIPPYLRMVDPWIGETASDNRLVAFSAANNLPAMAIGRLPALSAADADAMVAKIVGYEQSAPPGAWRNSVTFVSDNAYDASGNADPAGNFWNLSDSVAVTLPSGYTAERIYFNPCSTCPLAYPSYPSDVSVRNGIVSAINGRRLVVNYVGHSTIQYWAGEQLFRLDELNALANTDFKLPVMLAMTCYDGYFQFPGMASLAEANARLAGRGALASWSASGLGVATGHDYLDRGFLDAALRQGVTRIGAAALVGKTNLYATGQNLDLIDTFNLLGDPASRLAVP